MSRILRGATTSLFFEEFSPPNARLAMRKEPACSCEPSRGLSKSNEANRCFSRSVGVRSLNPHVRRGSAVSKHEKRILAVKGSLPRWALAGLDRQPYTRACSVPDETNHGMYNLMLIVTVGADFTPRIALWASNRRCLSTHSGALCQSTNSRRQQPD